MWQILLFVCIHVHAIVCVSIYVKFIPVSMQLVFEVTAISLIKILSIA